MADELYDLLDRPVLERSRTFLPDSPHSYLDKIVKPIHEILAAVRFQAQFGLYFGFLSSFSMLLKDYSFFGSRIAVGSLCSLLAQLYYKDNHMYLCNGVVVSDEVNKPDIQLSLSHV